MPTFEIPDSPVTIPLKAQIVKGQTQHVGQAAFTVTNKSGQTTTAHLSVVPQGTAKAEWLQVQGDAERDFTGNQTQKVVVNITAPPGTPPGDYKFYECVSNNNDRDNDYTNSAVVTFTVPPADVAKPGIPWWIWVVAGVVLLIIVGVGAYFIFAGGPSKVTVPNVATGQIAYADAAKQITDAKLTPKEVDAESDAAPAGNVFKQDPAAGAEADENSEVTLTVAKAPPPPPPAQTFPVPDVSSQGFTVDHAQGVLDANGFTSTAQNVAPQGKTPGTVVAQNPAAGAQVTADQKSVALSVDPGVAVPDISSAKNFNFQAAYNRLHNVGLEIGNQSCGVDAAHIGMIIAQGTATNTMVAKGASVAVTVGQQNCFIFHPFVLNQGIVKTNPNIIHLTPHH